MKQVNFHFLQNCLGLIIFRINNLTGKYVITTLDSILEDKTTEKEIEDALETLCSYLLMVNIFPNWKLNFYFIKSV